MLAPNVDREKVMAGLLPDGSHPDDSRPGPEAPFPLPYLLLLLVWLAPVSCLAGKPAKPVQDAAPPPALTRADHNSSDSSGSDADGQDKPASPNAAADAGDAPVLHPGEILVEGKVADVTNGENTIILTVDSFTLPGGARTAISPARKKNVVLGPHTSMHVRGETGKAVSLPYLVEGDLIRAVGHNLGTGKPLPADNVEVWRDFRDGKYTFEEPTPAPTESHSHGSRDLDAAAEVRALTGAHTRLVWCQTVDIRGKSRGSYRLACLDTDDGAGIRNLLWKFSSVIKPLITPSGNKIIFTNRHTNRIYVLNWDGTGLKRLLNGYAVDVWRDPATGVEWVYARTGPGDMKSSIRRYRLDRPEVSELVWDKTPLDQENYGWFQLSADGKRAAAAFPWPRCGIASLPNGSWQPSGAGCWTSIAPDNSYYNFRFDGTHKHIILCNEKGGDRRVITLSWAPGVFGNPVLYPRWTNNIHFITMTGPSFDRQGELYVGQFNEDFTAIKQWVRVTDSHISNIWGSAWIKPGKEENDVLAARAAAPETAGPGPTPTPVQRAPLEIQARLLARSHVPGYNEMAPYTRALVVNEYQVEKVVAGKYTSRKIRVAQWGVVHKKASLISHAAVGQTYHLVVQPFTDQPELESEFMSDSLPLDESLPLYYEPGSAEPTAEQQSE